MLNFAPDIRATQRPGLANHGDGGKEQHLQQNILTQETVLAAINEGEMKHVMQGFQEELTQLDVFHAPMIEEIPEEKLIKVFSLTP